MMEYREQLCEAAMAGDLFEALRHLLEECLRDWQMVGSVDCATPQTISLRTELYTLKISRAPAGMPFRWIIEGGDRRRTAASVTGVIRIVRQILAADYEPLNLRIAPLSQARS